MNKLSKKAIEAIARNSGTDLDDIDVDVLECEFSEFTDFIEAAESIGFECDDEQDAMDVLEEYAYMIPFEGGIVLYN